MRNFEILVNKQNQLGKDYIPDNLVEVKDITCDKIDNNYKNMLVKSAYLEYKKMQMDALKNGYKIIIDSSYRSYEYQNLVYDYLKKEKGRTYVEKYCAPPGSSEHQTGLAFDVLFIRNGIIYEEVEDSDEEIKWLHENCYKYGFILRYPKGSEKITGYSYEPWHFRYVGKKLAKYLYNKKITLEEYYIENN